MACFKEEGSDPSFIDLLTRTARSLANSSAPSFKSRAGMLLKPVDLFAFSFFNSFDTKVSLMYDLQI